MSRTWLGLAALALSSVPALAGGYGYGGGCTTGACYREVNVPPSYGTITERVVTQAPRTYAITTPAEYRTIHETVQVSPGGRHWQVSYDHHGNKVGCWVTTPPRYATVARTIQTRAPQVIPYAVPAQYGYRSYTVQTSPGYRGWAPVGGGYSAPTGGLIGAAFGAF